MSNKANKTQDTRESGLPTSLPLIFGSKTIILFEVNYKICKYAWVFDHNKLCRYIQLKGKKISRKNFLYRWHKLISGFWISIWQHVWVSRCVINPAGAAEAENNRGTSRYQYNHDLCTLYLLVRSLMLVYMNTFVGEYPRDYSWLNDL